MFGEREYLGGDGGGRGWCCRIRDVVLSRGKCCSVF